MTRKIQRNPFEKTIRFTDDELVYVRQIAEARQAPKDSAKVPLRDNRYVKRDNVDLHFIGLLGETAVAKLVYGFVDLRAYLGGDCGQDMQIFGSSVEVKTLQGYLAFKSVAHFTTDVAVLVLHDQKDFSQVWVEGWVENHFVDDFGYGPRPCMQPAALLPVETLRTFCLMRQMFSPLMDGARSLVALPG